MKSLRLETGAWLFDIRRTFAETAAVLRCTSHVTAKQHCNHLQIFKNALCKATLFSESHTHCPVNIPDPIRKRFGSGQLWPLQPAGAAGIGLDRIYILYAGPDFRPHLNRVRSCKDGRIILCKTSPDTIWFWTALSGCGRKDPFRKKAGVQESSGPLPANASEPDRYPDRMRIGFGMFTGQREDAENSTTVATVKRLGLISR